MHRRCEGFASRLFLRFVHAVFDVKFVHVPGVKPDDRHINDERALRAHPEAERPAEEIEIQVSGKVAHHKSGDKPYAQQ